MKCYQWLYQHGMKGGMIDAADLTWGKKCCFKACVELGHDPSEKISIFRIPGAWEEEGFKILERYGVPYADRSVSLNEAAKRAVEGAAA